MIESNKHLPSDMENVELIPKPPIKFRRRLSHEEIVLSEDPKLLNAQVKEVDNLDAKENLSPSLPKLKSNKV